MHSILKLAAVKRSTPAMHSALPDLPLDETILVRLIKIFSTSVSDYFEPVFKQVGVTEYIFHVLSLLLSYKNNTCSPGELTELVGTSKANMTRILERMLNQGLITKIDVPEDGRRYQIKITDKGREIATSTVPNLMSSLSDAFSGLSKEELTSLISLIEKALLSLDTSGINDLHMKLKEEPFIPKE